MSETFLIGGGQIHRLVGQRGETPPCPEAKFKRGDVVRVRRNREAGHFPAKMIVLAVVPPGFSPDDAMADLLGEPRPLMKQVERRSITYIVYDEDSGKHGYLAERNLLPSDDPAVEIGTVSREPDSTQKECG